MTSAADTMAK